MNEIAEWIARLRAIEQDPVGRPALIRDFQASVWELGSSADGRVDEVLSAIAHDLNFYVASPRERREDVSYYGDDALQGRIRVWLEEMRAL